MQRSKIKYCIHPEDGDLRQKEGYVRQEAKWLKMPESMLGKVKSKVLPKEKPGAKFTFAQALLVKAILH